MGRFIDWLTNLTAKSTTIDGSEITHIGSSGLSQKALLSDAIRYGGGNSTRVTTIGNANIHQKSDGTMWLEVTGQTAGNARGAGAFDWQPTRTVAANVASGANSFCFGIGNRADGQYSVCLGNGNYSVTAQNTLVGTSNTAYAGVRSFSAGYANSINATNQTTLGYFNYAGNFGQLTWGRSPDNELGCAQGNLQAFYTRTTDATSTPLNITGIATDRMVIPATRSCAFIGIVQAMCNVSSSSNFVKAWKIEGVITRDGNNTTRIVGTPTITVMAQDADGTPTPSTWAIASITADDTNEALAINVTGQTGQTIRWQCVLMYSQVGF